MLRKGVRLAKPSFSWEMVSCEYFCAKFFSLQLCKVCHNSFFSSFPFQFCYYCVYVIMKMKLRVSFVAKGVKLALAKWMLNKKNVMLFWWERWQVLLTVKKLLMDLSFCKMCHIMLLRSFGVLQFFTRIYKYYI